MQSVCLKCECTLTYEDREEENRHGDVEDRTGDVKEPIRSHREETEEKEEEKQTAAIFLHLTDREESSTRERSGRK